MFTSLTFITVVTVVTIIYTIFVFFFVNIFKDSGANVAPTSEVYVSPNLIITKEQKDKWTQIWFPPPSPSWHNVHITSYQNPFTDILRRVLCTYSRTDKNDYW